MNFTPPILIVLLVVCSSSGERWRWPQDGEPPRIDSKVRFIDSQDSGRKERGNHDRLQSASSHQHFHTAPESEGFYSSGEGRFPVRVDQPGNYRVEGRGIYGFDRRPNGDRIEQLESDGTLDSMQYCRCVTTPDCIPRTDLPNACSAGKYLCCYNGLAKRKGNDLFDDYENELFSPAAQPRPVPVLVGPEGPTGHVGPVVSKPAVLVGPSGPTGLIGPPQRPGLLVGPNGPTGVIGPQLQHQSNYDKSRNPGVLVGPSGPTGVIGPQTNGNNGVLVGPGGPTGIIGPANHNGGLPLGPDVNAQSSAQRGVLVGPGGPTGFIGPANYIRNPGILVGPGGPTGSIGPRRPGVLVGPGGPTGIIGPSRGYGYSHRQGMLVGPGWLNQQRPVLVGPGGPTGHIGPRRSDSEHDNY